MVGHSSRTGSVSQGRTVARTQNWQDAMLIWAYGYRAALNPLLREVGYLRKLIMQGNILFLGRWENVIVKNGVAPLSQCNLFPGMFSTRKHSYIPGISCGTGRYKCSPLMSQMPETPGDCFTGRGRVTSNV